jgi:hypothetical protein
MTVGIVAAGKRRTMSRDEERDFIGDFSKTARLGTARASDVGTSNPNVGSPEQDIPIAFCRVGFEAGEPKRRR